jgi:hypothetical protein
MGMNNVFFILMFGTMVLTLVSLAAGIIVMGKGGEANARYGNMLMRSRIILQGLAIVFFALALLTSA